jgi:hypothetical protein
MPGELAGPGTQKSGTYLRLTGYALVSLFVFSVDIGYS